MDNMGAPWGLGRADEDAKDCQHPETTLHDTPKTMKLPKTIRPLLEVHWRVLPRYLNIGLLTALGGVGGLRDNSLII